MIELVLTQMLNTLNTKSYPVSAPENTTMPYIIYHLNGSKTHLNIGDYKHRTVNVQLNIYADTYKQTKLIQSALNDLFDDTEHVYNQQEKEYSLSSVCINAVDLFNTDAKQVAMDVEIEYITIINGD